MLFMKESSKYLSKIDHVCLEGLLLHKTLVTQVTLVGPDVGVD